MQSSPGEIDVVELFNKPEWDFYELQQIIGLK